MEKLAYRVSRGGRCDRLLAQQDVRADRAWRDPVDPVSASRIRVPKAFRESMSLVTQSDSGYHLSQKQEKPKAMPITEAGQSPSTRSPETGVLSLEVPYGTGALAVEIRVSGEPLKRAHIERIRKYLELAESDLPNGSAS